MCHTHIHDPSIRSAGMEKENIYNNKKLSKWRERKRNREKCDGHMDEDIKKCSGEKDTWKKEN